MYDFALQGSFRKFSTHMTYKVGGIKKQQQSTKDLINIHVTYICHIMYII